MNLVHIYSPSGSVPETSVSLRFIVADFIDSNKIRVQDFLQYKATADYLKLSNFDN